MKLLLDPGHGWANGVGDPGACRGDFHESNWTFQFSGYLAECVRHLCEPWEIASTRLLAADNPTLEARGEMSRDFGADLVLSIHVNASISPLDHGGLTFYWPGNASGRAVADIIARALPEPLHRNGGYGIAATDSARPDDDWLKRVRACLIHHDMTSVLFEVGYCSSVGDLAAIMRPAIQSGLCAAALAGLARFRALNER